MHIDITKDLDARQMVVTTVFDAPVEKVWQLWADPRKLERWWGPPSHPATFPTHDLTPGGRCTYFMTGPDGARYHGWWRVLRVDAPTTLEVEDGFADGDGNPLPDLPVSTFRTELRPDGDRRTAVTITSTFATRDDMQQTLDMGVEEGLRGAMEQMPALLAED